MARVATKTSLLAKYLLKPIGIASAKSIKLINLRSSFFRFGGVFGLQSSLFRFGWVFGLRFLDLAGSSVFAF